jgi:hypothetical protein
VPQKPAGRGPYVLERVQGDTGRVDARARAPRDGVFADQEPEPPVQHVEGPVPAVLYVGRRPTPPGGMVPSKSEQAPPVSSLVSLSVIESPTTHTDSPSPGAAV